MTVKEIKKTVKYHLGVSNNESKIAKYDELLSLLSNDERSSVQKIYASLKLQRKKFVSDIIRLNEMFRYEDDLLDDDVRYAAGVDEVGRGPLAGPVVAAAVILPRKICWELCGLDDSKRLSEMMREYFADVIKKVAVSISIAVISAEKIDSIKIHNASLMAMERAVAGLETKPQHILIDGREKINADILQTVVIKGDSKLISIAAASVVAKVCRDNIMKEYHAKYPQYNFAKHKGYPTDEHVAAIRTHGYCSIHRKSFLKKILGDDF